MGPPLSPRRALLPWLALAGLLLATAAVYRGSLSGPFQFDDERGIERNLQIRSLSNYRPSELFRRVLDGSRPVTEATFALNFRWSRLDPFAYHATNVAVHLTNVVLAFLFARLVLRRAGLPGPEWLAAAGAGVFALHPLQTQAVSYVWQRAELLASLGYLTTLLLLERASAETGARRVLAWGSAFAAFGLGFGAKMVIVTAPAAFVLTGLLLPDPLTSLQAGPAKGRDLAKRVLLTLPLLALAAVFSFVTIRSLGGRSDVGFSVPGLTPGRYALNQVPAVAGYIRLFFWPAGQNVDPDVPLAQSLLEGRVLLAAVLLAAMASGAVALGWRFRVDGSVRGGACRVISFGILWYFLLLSPTSSFVPLADVFVEHRTYLASLGLALAALAGGALLVRRAPFPPATSAALAALAALLALATLSLATKRRDGLWASPELLWRDTVAKSPRKARAQMNLAWALAREGRHAEAIGHYEIARTCGDGSVDTSELLVGLGFSLYQTSRGAEAIGLFRQATAANRRNPDAWNNLAICLFDEGNLEESAKAADEALAIDPSHPGALSTSGEVSLRTGDPTRAAALFRRALAIQPSNAVIHYNLALALEAGRDGSGACQAWRDYLRVEVAPAGQAEGRGQLLRLGCGPGQS